MGVASKQEPRWKERLGLERRSTPVLYESSSTVADVPYAAAIRVALDDLGLTAVFCVQNIPTIAILVSDQYDRDAISDLHGALWNQGLASVLLVIAGSTLRLFSLVRTPLQEPDEFFESRCLISSLEMATDALLSRELIPGVESGRLWRDNASFFPSKERVDRVLLDNLLAAHRQLQDGSLNSEEAQALLTQTMFISYLEDRDILTAEYFRAISNDRVDNFLSLLECSDVNLLRDFFQSLRDDFNGDLFVGPCTFEPKAESADITEQSLEILARFKSGREEMANGGQQRFWGYDFKYIPIELVSAVYDRFLGERENERRKTGAYYTPMFLADLIVSQTWQVLPERVKQHGRFLDPACGSGIFLVRSFQYLCENWRNTHKSDTIPWKTLLTLVDRINGWDINAGAIRVSVFSIYIGLLDEVSHRDIKKLIKRGKLLPKVWGRNLINRDFFSV